MHRQVIDYMRAHDITVLCLQETKSKQTTQYVVDNYTFMTISTAPSSQPEHAGVGFVLSPLARNALVRVQPVNSRIASVSLLMAAGELHIVNTYVPHNARPEDERRAHFDQLQEHTETLKRKGPFLVVGDFKARLHGKLHGEGDVLGPHMFGKGYHAIGEDEFCRSQELLVANTWYKQPPRRQVTYSAPGTQHLPPDNSNWDPDKFAQLNFILVPRRWRNACRNVFSQPRANLDSDHFPVVALMQYKLSARKRQPKPRHFQFRKATASQLTAMNQEIDQALDATNPLASDPTRQWQTLSAVYIQALDRHIPTQHNAPRHPWITNHTLPARIEKRN